ncbi:MAG: hydantoinase/oxoprolinase family protein, partial [Gaiellales bacterium]
LVNESMTNAARVHAVERGKDPGSMPLFAFGGAGPVHACGVARALGVPRLVGPPGAGVLSAIGFLTAPLAFDFVRSVRARIDELAWADVDVRFAEMEAEGSALLVGSGVPADAVSHRRFADLRHEGQGYEIRVPVAAGADDFPGSMLAAFDEVYRTLYERPGPHVPVEAVNWRVVSSGPRPAFELTRKAEPGAGETRKGGRPVWFPEAGGYVETEVHDRYAMQPGRSLEGPVIVEEHESTFVVPPGARCAVSADGSLVVEFVR